MLEMYERRRKTVYPDPSKHPGIETVQSILAYFKLHGIRTKVIGTRFRTVSWPFHTACPRAHRVVLGSDYLTSDQFNSVEIGRAHV